MDMLAAMSLIPVVHARGPELNQVLLRYLTEIVWFPAAVPSPFITWQPIDNISARATLEYRRTRASATFIIDENGDVLQAQAERYREEHGRWALRSWVDSDHPVWRIRRNQNARRWTCDLGPRQW